MLVGYMRVSSDSNRQMQRDALYRHLFEEPMAPILRVIGT